jgi:hypothetical protein
MTDNQPNQPNQPNEANLSDELRKLGQSLSEFLRTAWASEERKKVQKDLETSLSELGTTINKAANEFSESKTGQQMKADLKDLKTRFENGQVQDKSRQELLAALKRVNEELTKAANRWGPTSADTSSPKEPKVDSTGSPE